MTTAQKTVHILLAGTPLCGKPGTPNTWEKDHVWVDKANLAVFTEGEPLEGVTLCATCAQYAAGMEA